MEDHKYFDIIVVGGSYSGLAAAMALGRALRSVLIIDDGQPCNRQTPHSHNFITHDGSTPKQIAMLAKEQVAKYKSVDFFNGLAVEGIKTEPGFQIRVASGEVFNARKLIFATGVNDIMQNIDGYAECWGISVLHCPYCHGYEVRNETTGILANGELAMELSALISNWTKDLTVFTNGASTLTAAQIDKLKSHSIKLVDKKIDKLVHVAGQLKSITFNDGTTASIKAVYARSPFEQHCTIPLSLGCQLSEDGYIKIDTLQKTSVAGVFACGDNTSRFRTVANTVAMGTMAGMAVNREIIFEDF